MKRFFKSLFMSKYEKEIEELKLRISTLECKFEVLMKMKNR
ncbi:MAG: hypothetical protein ACLSV2_08480 [Clostridium sp.]